MQKENKYGANKGLDIEHDRFDHEEDTSAVVQNIRFYDRSEYFFSL
jgi:hypothetical protein